MKIIEGTTKGDPMMRSPTPVSKRDAASIKRRSIQITTPIKMVDAVPPSLPVRNVSAEDDVLPRSSAKGTGSRRRQNSSGSGSAHRSSAGHSPRPSRKNSMGSNASGTIRSMKSTSREALRDTLAKEGKRPSMKSIKSQKSSRSTKSSGSGGRRSTSSHKVDHSMSMSMIDRTSSDRRRRPSSSLGKGSHHGSSSSAAVDDMSKSMSHIHHMENGSGTRRSSARDLLLMTPTTKAKNLVDKELNRSRRGSEMAFDNLKDMRSVTSSRSGGTSSFPKQSFPRNESRRSSKTAAHEQLVDREQQRSNSKRNLMKGERSPSSKSLSTSRHSQQKKGQRSERRTSRVQQPPKVIETTASTETELDPMAAINSSSSALASASASAAAAAASAATAAALAASLIPSQDATLMEWPPKQVDPRRLAKIAAIVASASEAASEAAAAAQDLVVMVQQQDEQVQQGDDDCHNMLPPLKEMPRSSNDHDMDEDLTDSTQECDSDEFALQ